MDKTLFKRGMASMLSLLLAFSSAVPSVPVYAEETTGIETVIMQNFTATLGQTENGKINFVSDGNEIKEPVTHNPGEIVTVAVTPGEGFAVAKVEIKDADEKVLASLEDEKVTVKDGMYEFAMPETNVTVDVVFEAVATTETETETEAETDVETEVDTEAQQEAEVETETDVKSETDVDTETEVDANVDTNKDTDSNEEVDVETDTTVDTETETDIETESSTDSETDVDVNSEAESETDVDANSDVKDETDTNVDEETDTETNEETGTKTDVDADTDTESRTLVGMNKTTRLWSEAEQPKIFFSVLRGI